MNETSAFTTQSFLKVLTGPASRLLRPGITNRCMQRLLAALALLLALLVAASPPAQAQTPGFLLTTTTLTVAEGDSSTFAVRLATRPSTNMTVTIAASNSRLAIDTDPDTPGNQNTLAFDRFGQTNAWNQYKGVTVTALQNYDQNITITLTGAGGDYQGRTATIAATITPKGRIVLTPTGGLEFDEGGSSVFDVHLSAAPASDVTVTLTKTHSGITLDKTTLTFTSTNYASKQRVRVSSGADDDHQDISDTITLSATGGIDADDVTKPVRVVDTDTGGFDFTAAAIVLQEGDNASVGNSRTMTIRINTAPDPGSSTAKIRVTSSDTGAVTVSPSELTFSRQAWHVSGSVTIRWVPDADGTDESVDLTISAISGYSGVADATKMITVRDDDGSITVSSAAVDITEGGSTGNFTVRLGAPPKASAVLSVSSGDTGAVTVSPASLTFTSSNWNSPQTVTVTGVQDNDGTDESVNVTVSTTSGYRADNVTKSIAVTDDGISPPPPGAIVVTYDTGKFTLNTPEGGTNDFFVRLSAEPSSNVTVTLTKTNAEVSLSPTTLTFTTANWNTAQTVTITVAEDADAEHDSDTITLSASGGIAAADVTEDIRIADNEVGWEADVDKVVVIEGSTTTFNLRLTTQPKAGIFSVETNVGLSSPSVFIDTNDQAAGSQTTLNIARDSWDTYMPITVTANEDDNQVNEAYTIDLLGNQGSGRWMQARGALAVEVIDNDGPAPTVMDASVDGTTLTVTFSGTMASTKSPDSAWAVNVAGSARSVTGYTLSGSTASLTLASAVTPGQTVTLDYTQPGSGDTLRDLAGNALASFSNQSVTNTTAPTTGTIQVTPAGTLTIDEGASGNLSVSLSTQPASDVTVSLAKTNTDVSLTPTSLTFTTANWDTSQTVTVSATQDADTDNDSDTITLTATGGIDASSVTKAVTITDVPDTTAPTITDASINGATLTLTFSEDISINPARTFNVYIHTAAFFLTANGSDITVNTFDRPLGVRTVTLTMTRAVDALDTVTLTHNTPGDSTLELAGDDVFRDGAGNRLADFSNLAVTNNTPDLTAPTITGIVHQTPATSPTNADSLTWRVSFSEAVTDIDNADFSVSGAGLTTPTLSVAQDGNTNAWDVSVSGGNLNNYNGTITLSLASAQNITDIAGNALSTTLPGDASNTWVLDNTAPTVLDASVNGATLTVTFSKTMASTKAANAAWAVSVAGSSRSVSSYTLSDATASLTLASAVSANQAVTLGYTQPGGNDNKLQDSLGNDLANFSNRGVTNLTAPTITGITRQTPATSPTNADSLTWRVSFSAAVSNVDHSDFGVSGSGLGSPTLSVAQVGSSNAWDVSISGGNLADYNGTVTLSLAGTQNITSNNTGIVLVSTLPGGASNTYTVDNTPPIVTGASVDGATLTVTFSETMAGDKAANAAWAVSVAGSARSVSSYTLSGRTASLTLGSAVTAGETVTLGYTRPGSGDKLQDALGNELASFSHDVTNATLVTPGFIINPTSVTVGEGSSVTFRVSLSRAPGFRFGSPSPDVTVTFAQPGNTDVTVDTDPYTAGNQTTLTFTPNNWDRRWRVDITAAADADTVDDSATIGLTASGSAISGYSGVTGGVAIAVIDDDTAAPIISSIERWITPRSHGDTPRNPTNADILTWRVTFSEAVTNVDNTDFTVSGDGGSLGGPTLTATQVGSTNAWYVGISGGNLADYNGTVTLSLAGNQDITDADNNPLSTTLPGDNTYVLDNAGPTIINASINRAALTLTFSEDLGDFSTISASNIANFNITVPGHSPIGFTHGAGTFINVSPGIRRFLMSSAVSAGDTVTLNVNNPASNPILRDLVRNPMADVSNLTVTNLTPGLLINPTRIGITEGGDSSFSVKLAAQPTGTVLVTVAQPSNTDITVDTDSGSAGNQTILAFTRSNWDTAQAVTVSAAADADRIPDNANIGIRTSNYGNVTGSVAVAVADNDSLDPTDTTAPTITGITRQTPATSPTNADSLTWRVSFSEAVTNIDNADFSVSGAGLTTPTLSVARDGSSNAWDVTASGGNLNNYNGTVTLGLASGQNIIDNGGNILVSTLPGGAADTYVLDNTVPTVLDASVNGATLTITFSETLASTKAPNGAWAVSVANSARSVSSYTLSGATASLTLASAVSHSQTITLGYTRPGSGDTLRDLVGYELASLSNQGVTNVTPDPTDTTAPTITGIVRQTPATSPTNADSLTWRVSFSEAVSNVDTADFTVSGDSGSLGSPTLTATQVGSSNAWDVSASGGNLAAYDGTVTLGLASGQNIIDNGANALVSTLPGDASNTYVLDNTAPTITDASINGSTLIVTFSETMADILAHKDRWGVNISQRQFTTVTRPSRYTLSGNTATLTLPRAILAGEPITMNYSDLEVGNDLQDLAGNELLDFLGLSVTNVAPVPSTGTIQVTPAGTLTIDEGASGNLSVSLSAAPNADVTVSLAKTNGDVTLSPTSLTFTTANWDTSQTVTVSAAQDADTDNDSDTITLTATGGITAPNVTRAVTITDDDSATTPTGTIQVTPAGTLTIDEGASGNLSVSLSTRPNANVTVSLAKTNTDVSLSPTSLTFTTDNWDTSQTVTVSAAQDADTNNDSDTITLTATGGITAPNVTRAVTITDVPDTTAPTITDASINGATLTVTFSEDISLNPTRGTQIYTSVFYFFLRANGSDIKASTYDRPLGVRTVTFTMARAVNFGDTVTLNYNTPQDSLLNINDVFRDGAGNALRGIRDLAVTNTTPTTPTGTIQVTPAGTLTIDEGASGNLSVSLSTAPNANVTVSLAKTNGDVTLSPTLLTFTTANWDTSQTVTVSAAQDADTDNDSDTITLAATGGITAPNVTRAVTITDDDSATTPTGTIQVTPGGTLTIDEGASGNLSVSLSTAPNANVTVSLAKTNTDVSLSPTSLTFTTDNWDTSQTVTVSAAQDADTDNDSDTITLSATGGIDASSVTKAVTITDDDTATTPTGTIQVTPAGTLTIDEGASGNLSVSLSTQPNADVTVSLAKTNTDVSLSPTSLTFTTDNWDTSQNVTVSAAQDADSNNDSDTITLTATGGIDASSVTKAVTITDVPDTTPPTVVSASVNGTILTVTFSENLSSPGFAFDWSTNPSMSYQFTGLTSGDTLTITLHPGVTAGQTITLNYAKNSFPNSNDVARDAAGNELANFSNFAVTNNTPATPTGTIQVTPAGTLTIDEGASGNLSVSLSTQPNADVTVSLAKTNTDVTLSPASLTFTSSNWDTSQTVTVSAAQDADTDNDSDTITLTATGGIDASSVAKVVTITDDDTTAPTGTIQVTPAGTLTIDEGASGNLSVSLSTQPNADVTVSLAKTNTDVSLSPTSLTFTTANWDTSQTVTVSAAQDSDTNNDSDTITLTATGGIDAPNVTRAVTITDDDEPGIILSISPVVVNEDNSATVGVRLTEIPTLNGTPFAGFFLRVTSSDTNVFTVSPSMLAFDDDNLNNRIWSDFQTLTITPVNDNIFTSAIKNATINVSDGVRLSSVNYFGFSDTIPVQVREDDAPTGTIQVTPAGTLTIDEGASGNLSVSLSTAPNANVTVSLAKTNTDVSLSATSLTFTTANWDTSQTVTVSAAQDNDGTDDSDTITLTATGGIDASSVAKAVTITDDDTATTPTGTIQVTPASTLTIDEGASGNLSVSLSTQPNADVTVSLAKTNTDVTLSPTSLTFTSSNWDTSQTVTVSAAQDADTDNDSDTITLTATGGIEASSVTKAVTITDDDSADTTAPTITGITRQTPATSPTNADSLTWRVSFSEAVTNIDNADFSVSGDSGNLGSPTLSVARDGTTNNWDIGVSGGNLAAYNGTVTLGLASNQDITDSADNALSTTLPGDAANTYVLDNTAPTVLDASVNGATLTVTFSETMDSTKASDSAWAVNVAGNARNVSSYTLSDNTAILTLASAVVGGDAVTLGYTKPGSGDTLKDTSDNELATFSNRSVTNNTPDPSTPTGTIQVTPAGTLTIDEGASGNLSVSLSTRPNANVTVSLAKTNTDVSLTPTSLTFTTGNWDTSQTVTVSAAQDADTDNDSDTITLTATGGIDASSVAKAVTITDDDSAGLTISTGSVTVAEGGNSSFTIRLATQPSENVTVTVAQPSNTDVTVDTDSGTNGNQTTLTFTGSNWDTAQSVSVNAAGDADTLNDNATLSITATGADYGDQTGSVTVSVTDDDSAGLTIDPGTLNITEGGNDSFSIRLATQPSENVTVTVAQPSNTDITVDTDSGTNGNQTSLTFTSDNWSTAQHVTVSAAEDADIVNDSASLSITATGADYGSVTGSVGVSVTDNDRAGLTINPPSVTIGEGSSGNFSVSLTTQPSENVTVTVAQPSNSDISISPVSLTFTSSNWSTAQSVTVNAAEDDDTLNDNATLNISASGADYGSVTGSVGITVNDNDSPGLLVDPGTLNITEGDNGNFSIRLATQPSENVTVTVAQPSNTDITVDTDSGANGNQTTLTFTNSNWSTAQSVTVSTAEDTDTDNDNATLSINASGANYGSVTGSVGISVTDNDSPGLTINPPSVTIGEGSSGNFSIRLATQPSENVTVTVAQPSNTDITVDTDSGTAGNQTTLTFTSNNWSTAQGVTVNAAEDADTDNDSATISINASGANYGGVTGSVNVTVTDLGTTRPEPPPGSSAPTFGSQVQADLNLTQGVAIAPVTLPAASGGDGALQYRISPSLPAGLRFNAVTRQLSGTPVSVGTTHHNYIASDSDNDTRAEDQASLGFNINIRVSRDTATRQATQGWLSRFGRGIGEQAVQGIRKRIQQPVTTGPQPGAAQLQTNLGGHSIDLNQPLSSTAAGLLKQLEQLDRSNLLYSSSFSASGESGEGQLSLWGQGAHSSFASKDNGVDLDGKLSSLLLGSDYRRDNWAAGILLSRSKGEGDYRGEVITGELESDLTSVVPWGSIQMSEELSIWGAMGQGQGDLRLQPERESEIKADLDWQMLAGGMQSRLIKASERNRMGLSFTGDLLWTETTTDRVARLQAIAGETRRVRLGLEADWYSSGGLTPRLELGIRHDSGDAETGLGVELGGGLTWQDGRGNRLEVNGRGLLTHDDSDSRDWGLSIVAQHDARPSSHRGFSLRLSHELGGSATGGIERLMKEDLLSAGSTAGHRWELEMAYGMARARGLTGSGYTALSGGAGSGMGWRVGYRLQSEHTSEFEIDLHVLDAREADEVDPGVGLNFIWR